MITWGELLVAASVTVAAYVVAVVVVRILGLGNDDA